MRELRIGELVTFVGEVDDVQPWLQRAHAVVVPSIHPEGLGLVAVEALALARPVITTGAGGLREVVDDSCGWLYRDESELAHLLRGITRPEIEQRAHGARSTYLGKFTEAAYTRSIGAVFFEIEP